MKNDISKQNVVKKFLYKDHQYISYTEYGNPSGFPLIVQHGLIASIRNGEIFGDSLNECARIICVARPGYGQSSPVTLNNYKEWGSIVACLADELSLTTFDVFGSSAGSSYAYAVGYTCSALVRNIYIYSGSPAFYDKEVQLNWPYPVKRDIPQSESEEIARRMFFADMPQEMLAHVDVIDSMQHNCFGVAQELSIRFEDWGFELSGIKAKVYLQHSKQDDVIPYKTAVRTAALLPDGTLELLEEGPHFSVESYQRFIENTIRPNI